MGDTGVKFSAQQRLLLLRLALTGDWTAQKDLKPTLTKAQRLPLLTAGLVEEEQRQRRAVFLRLTEAGWVWMEAHLNEPLGISRNTAATILELLLQHVSALLRRREIPLAELSGPLVFPALSPSTESLTDSSLSDEEDLDQLIESACLELGKGERNTRIRLSELRDRLAAVSREALDRRLLELAQQGRLQLYRLDNPLEIFAADQQAELQTASGEPRHLVYLTQE